LETRTQRASSGRSSASTEPILSQEDCSSLEATPICLEVSEEADSTCFEKLPTGPQPLLLSKEAEFFRLASQRNTDSDDEDDFQGFEAEDRFGSLNTLLVLDERQEGIRRYRSSVDDDDRNAYCESSTRERLVEQAQPVLLLSEACPNYEVQAAGVGDIWGPPRKSPIIFQRLLCFLVTATIAFGLAALWHTNHQSSGNGFVEAGVVSPAQRGSPEAQGIDQRPGSWRLEALQNRNRLSNF